MKKRKRYVEKATFTNSVQRAISMAAKIDAAERQELKQNLRKVYDGFRAGMRCSDAWGYMARVLNVSERLADMQICSDLASLARIERGQVALAAVWKRQAAGGNWTLYPSEMGDLEEAMWLYGVQLEHCSRGEWHRADAYVQEYARQVLAGNGPRNSETTGVTCLKQR